MGKRKKAKEVCVDVEYGIIRNLRIGFLYYLLLVITCKGNLTRTAYLIHVKKITNKSMISFGSVPAD